MLQLSFSPFPEIKTQRLLLRRLNEGDAAAMLFLRSDEAVMHYICREKMKTTEEAVAFIRKINTAIDNNENIIWAIALQDNPGTLIGTITFWHIYKEHYRAETGYMLHPAYWNKGFMKESLLAIIDYGFNVMKLHSIEARIHPDNLVSGRLLEKTGFTKDAYFKEDFYYNGQFLDTIVYSLVNG